MLLYYRTPLYSRVFSKFLFYSERLLEKKFNKLFFFGKLSLSFKLLAVKKLQK
jgi:hypothetical protein